MSCRSRDSSARRSDLPGATPLASEYNQPTQSCTILLVPNHSNHHTMASKPIALVTGASSGIGRTSAIALIVAGWRVVLSGRRKEELEATAEMARKALREAGKDEEAKEEDLVLVCVGDVAKEGNVKEMFEEVEKVYGESIKERGSCGRWDQIKRIEVPMSCRCEWRGEY